MDLATNRENRPMPRALKARVDDSAIGDTVERVFRKALIVDRSRRPQDAEAVWSGLNVALHDQRSEDLPSIAKPPAPRGMSILG